MYIDKLHILLAEDHQLFRNMLCDTIRDVFPDARVTGVANGNEVMEFLRTQSCQVIIMDMNMPELDGLSTIKLIRASDQIDQPKILVLSAYDHALTIHSALTSGANGYVLKNIDIRGLSRAINIVLEGGEYLQPEVKSTYLHFALRQEPSPQGKKDLLSLQETKVLYLICLECTNNEIADQLNITYNTVVKHKMNIRERIGAKSLVSYVKFALANGIISKEELAIF